MSQTFDTIVIGAGAMGSATAYYLARAGEWVLLVEQFEIDHQKGSSYGYSRIIRYAYDHPAYIELMKAAYPAWERIEAEAGERLYTRTGGLDFGRPDEVSLQTTINSLRQAGIPHEVVNAEEAMRRFPQFRLSPDIIALYQSDAGILSASKCVRAHVRLAEQHGTTVLANTPVKHITATTHHVTVETESGVYSAGRLVITAGSWARAVLGELGLDLPLTPMRCQEIYFEAEPMADYEASRFPVFITHLDDEYDRSPYGIADHDGSGVKIAFHGGQTVEHPSQVNYTPDDDEVDRASQFARKYLPGVGRMRSTRICLYTMTPDQHFVIDRHPEYPNVVIGAGFPGHGFKFSTLVGEILADLALKGTTAHDIRLFTLKRFANRS